MARQRLSRSMLHGNPLAMAYWNMAQQLADCYVTLLLKGVEDRLDLYWEPESGTTECACGLTYEDHPCLWWGENDDDHPFQLKIGCDGRIWRT